MNNNDTPIFTYLCLLPQRLPIYRTAIVLYHSRKESGASYAKAGGAAVPNIVLFVEWKSFHQFLMMLPVMLRDTQVVAKTANI
jgi:hypothetical protein